MKNRKKFKDYFLKIYSNRIFKLVVGYAALQFLTINFVSNALTLQTSFFVLNKFGMASTINKIPAIFWTLQNLFNIALYLILVFAILIWILLNV